MVHASSDIIKIDPDRTKVIKHSSQGDASEVRVDYQITDDDFFHIDGAILWGRAYYRLILAEELQPNEHKEVRYSVEFSFTGIIGNKTSFFTKPDGGGNIIAATKFGHINARSAFPCFDEPGLKAKFTVELVVPGGYQAYSNMLPNKTNRKKRVITFDESPVMSSYLVAFVITKYKYKESRTERGVIVRSFFLETNLALVQYASRVAPQILTELESWFPGVKYPLPKLDLIPIPGFVSAGMENWGLVTFKPGALLYDERVMTVENKCWVLKLLAHEIIHQWVGNLVTMDWWNDIWLNEGITTFFTFIMADKIDPSVGYMDFFVRDKRNGYMDKDTHVLSPDPSVVNTNPHFEKLFDIAYEKGSNIIAMIRHFMKPDIFRRGLVNYLRARSYKTATTQQLWDYLQRETKTLHIKEIMKPWMKQRAFPLLTVTRNYNNNSVTLSQESVIENNQDLWWIYGDYFYADGDGTIAGDVWMPRVPRKIFSIAASADRALLFNKDSLGYYRVNYDQKNWAMIRDVLLTNHNRINVKNRAQIISDVGYLVRKKLMNISMFMEIHGYLKNEIEWLPWATALKIFKRIRNVKIDQFIKFLQNLISPTLDRLGYNTSLEDQPQQILLRNEIIFNGKP